MRIAALKFIALSALLFQALSFSARADENDKVADALQVTLQNPDNPQETAVVTQVFVDSPESLKAARAFAQREIEAVQEESGGKADVNLLTINANGLTQDQLADKHAPAGAGADFFAEIEAANPKVESFKVTPPKTWLSKLAKVKTNVVEWLNQDHPAFDYLFAGSLVVIRFGGNAVGPSLGLKYTYGISIPHAFFFTGMFGGSASGGLQLLNKTYGRWLEFDGLFGLAADPEKNLEKAAAENVAIERKTAFGRTLYEGKKLLKEFGLISLLFHGYFACLYQAGLESHYSFGSLELSSFYSLLSETGFLFFNYKLTKTDSIRQPRLAKYFNIRSKIMSAVFSLLVTTPQIISAGAGDDGESLAGMSAEIARMTVVGMAVGGWAAYAWTFDFKVIKEKTMAWLKGAGKTINSWCGGIFG